MLITKSKLRNNIRKEVGLLFAKEKEKKSRLLCEHLEQTIYFQKAKTIGLFASDPTEPDTKIVFDMCMAYGKKVAFPEIHGNRLIFRWVSNWKDLKTKTFGLSEPSKGRIAHIGSLDVLCIPAMAVDEKGRRLGRGKGFYDRALSVTTPGQKKIGCVFSNQIVSHVPTSTHDKNLDAIVSDKGVWVVQS